MSSKKSFSNETSERYSRALFEVAKEAGELEKMETDITNFQLIFNNSAELKNFIQKEDHLILIMIINTMENHLIINQE